MRVFEQDARVWVKRAATAPKRYDLIMLDAFNGDYIPEHLMTREYLAETRANCSPMAACWRRIRSRSASCTTTNRSPMATYSDRSTTCNPTTPRTA